MTQVIITHTIVALIGAFVGILVYRNNLKTLESKFNKFDDLELDEKIKAKEKELRDLIKKEKNG